MAAVAVRVEFGELIAACLVHFGLGQHVVLIGIEGVEQALASETAAKSAPMVKGGAVECGSFESVGTG